MRSFCKCMLWLFVPLPCHICLRHVAHVALAMSDLINSLPAWMASTCNMNSHALLCEGCVVKGCLLPLPDCCAVFAVSYGPVETVVADAPTSNAADTTGVDTFLQVKFLGAATS